MTYEGNRSEEVGTQSLYVAKGRGRDRSQDQGQGTQASGDQQGTTQEAFRPVDFHSAVSKDIRRLDPQVAKAAHRTIEMMAGGQTHSSDHPLHGPLKGWRATDVIGQKAHRITYRNVPDGPIEIGHIGPHNYDQAVQRLASMPPAERTESVKHMLTHYVPTDFEHWHEVRDNFDWNHPKFKAFVDDVARNGVKRPIPVDYESNPPKVMNGHTRLLAAEKAGITHVPTRQHEGWMDPDDPDAYGRGPDDPQHWTNQEHWASKRVAAAQTVMVHPSELWGHTRDLSLPHHQRKVQELAESIGEHGYDPDRADLPVRAYWDASGHPGVTEGHHRLKAMEQIGYDQPIPVETHSPRTAMGMAGPDYDNLSFHTEDQPGSDFHYLHAIHPEHGDIGELAYHRNENDHRLTIGDFGVDRPHRRRGVGSQLMAEVERQHPGYTINHGGRTPSGNKWAEDYYGPEGVTKEKDPYAKDRRGRSLYRSIPTSIQPHTGAAFQSFHELAPHEQAAVSTYHEQMQDEDPYEGDTPHNYRYEKRSEPVEHVKSKVMQGDYGEDFDNFDEYHKSRTDTPRHPTTNRWPVIVNDANHNYIDDGFHRLHSYIDSGATHIPTIRMHWKGANQHTASLTTGTLIDHGMRTSHGRGWADSYYGPGASTPHPEHGMMGQLDYFPPKRSNGPVTIGNLRVEPEHQRKGVGSAIMDEVQRMHPNSAVNHGDRTNDGKAWWSGYTNGKEVNRGRTAINQREAMAWAPHGGMDEHEAQAKSVRDAGFKGFVGESEERNEEHENLSDRGFDEDLWDRHTPEPTSHEQSHYEEHDEYPDSYHARHEKAYFHAQNEKRKENVPDVEDDHLHHFVAEHGGDSKLWRMKGKLGNVDLSHGAYATQSHVGQTHINRYLANPNDKAWHLQQYGDSASHDYLANEKPMFVTHQGRLHVTDGHHRVAAALQRGDKSIEGYHFNLDKHPVSPDWNGEECEECKDFHREARPHHIASRMGSKRAIDLVHDGLPQGWNVISDHPSHVLVSYLEGIMFSNVRAALTWDEEQSRPQRRGPRQPAQSRDWGTFWHGTPSGDLRGGAYGLHVGTQEAARQALHARIGFRADGKDWDGTQEYGKTLLAGKQNLLSRERGQYLLTGHNTRGLPEHDHYPHERSETPSFGSGRQKMQPHHKPDLFPVKITGEMSNTPQTAHPDFKANGYMKAQITKGNAKRGYFYTNEGEDAGSVSAVVPNGDHVERVNRKEAAARWTPNKRVFTHTCGLDHRLFDGEKLRPEVRRYILRTLGAFWLPLYGPGWDDWSKVYFAGSEASEWTSETLEGNNDFDVLVGVDYTKFKVAHPEYASWTKEQITDQFNTQFRSLNNPNATITVDGVPYGPFDNTWYVNKDSYNIKDIKPYAAYNVSDNAWAVKPPHLPHWSLSDVPRAVQRVLRACDTLANDILKLPEPERTQQGNALFEAWHSDRSRAFGPNGEGWYDIANLREKWLDQEGTWAELVNCAHRWNEGLGAAKPGWSNNPRFGAVSGFSEGNQFCERLDKGPDEEPYLNSDEFRAQQRHRDYTAPTGHTYRLLHDGNTQISAHQRLSNGKYRGVGYLNWFGGKNRPEDESSNINGGKIYKTHVSEQHRRRGIASAMLDFGREKRPDLRHSNALSEDGRAWSEKKASRSTETLDSIGKSEHPNVDHYQSGGMGHLEGDESRSVVGFMPTHMMEKYREHDGDWNGEHSRETVDKIRGDIRSGKGITSPIMVEYNHVTKKGYIGEGNHRLRAAQQEGAKTVPVRVVRSGFTKNVGSDMELQTQFGHSRDNYVPSDIHPYHFIKENQHTAAYETSVYGTKDVDKMFGDRLTSPTPFPQASRRKSNHDFDENLVARSITHPHEFPLQNVDTRELRSRQPSVTKDGVSHYMDDSNSHNGDHRLGNDVPRIYHREDGQKIILSGHHRATAAFLKGEPLKAMVIKGPWGKERGKVAVHIDDYQHDPDKVWYHGSPHKFPEFNDLKGSQSGDWNTSLGHHFTSEPDVAKSFGKHQYRVQLPMHNPKVYNSEKEMDNEVMHYEHERKNHYTNHVSPSLELYTTGNGRSGWKADKALRSGNIEEAEDNSHHWLSKHPDRRNIVNNYRSRLQEAGHDGIVYGNDWEKPGHASAIAFPGKPIVPLPKPKGELPSSHTPKED